MVDSTHRCILAHSSLQCETWIPQWSYLRRITTNLGPIYELKNSGFLGLVSSRQTYIVRSQASAYIDVGERLTYEETKSV